MHIRDIHQIREAPAFAAVALDGLLSAEDSLHDAMRFVPYCEKHRGVWSAQFARIILECASQVDSVWKASTSLDDPKAKVELKLKDHFKRFGKFVARQHVIFFPGSTPSLVSPFSKWESGTFNNPEWWDAYNALKHDRFSNHESATLEHAVNSAAALFLAILYSGRCDMALISADLLDTSNYNPWADNENGLLRDVPFQSWSKIETKLFAHPLGIFGAEKCNLSNWWRSKSVRFNAWWALNGDKFTKPLK